MSDQSRQEVESVGRVVFVVVWLAVAAACLFVAVRVDLPAWQAGLGTLIVATIVAGSLSDQAKKHRRERLRA